VIFPKPQSIASVLLTQGQDHNPNGQVAEVDLAVNGQVLGTAKLRKDAVNQRLALPAGTLAKDAGMKFAVLTSKHVAGHCLWVSKVQFRGKEFDNDVATSGDKTEVIAGFVTACKKYGIAPGLYWCRSIISSIL
jgi:hypothetical protein